jgi:hypothetical protein
MSKICGIHSLLILASIFSACQKHSAGLENPGRRASQSKMSTVNIKLPDQSAIKPTSGSNQINGYQFTVSPSSGCTDGTIINEIKSYADTQLTSSLKNGCDYDATLALGELTSGNTITPYFSTVQPVHIAANQLTGGVISVPMTLRLTAQGQQAHFSESTPVNPVLPSPSPSVAPTPTTPPTPQNGSLAPLAEKLKVTVYDNTGVTEVPFEQVFSTEYLVIDFSVTGCGYCTIAANKLNSNTTRQSIYDGKGKCRAITIDHAYDVKAWARSIGTSSFVGKNSYGAPPKKNANGQTVMSGMSHIASLFGLPSGFGTPTFIFVDRAGNILKQTEGEDREFDSYADSKCK